MTDPRKLSINHTSTANTPKPTIAKTILGTIITSVLTEAQLQGQVGQGWVLCDGQSVAGTPYETLTSTSTAPDLRGRFLRGLDTAASVDPDGSGRTVGDAQSYKTALPNNNFTSNTKGNHAHYSSYDDDEVGSGGKVRAKSHDGGNDIKTSTTGNHSHSITGGGDNETRPVNISVNYFMYVGF